MEDIRTATVAFKALVELGYPLELSKIVDYLTKLPNSKDELIQFDNEEALCSFLKKFPSMFWVKGIQVFPAQMKPKGGPRCSNKTGLPQSHPVVQPASNSSDKRRQQDQPMDKVEEQGEDKNRAPDSKVGRLDTENNGDKERNQKKEERNNKDGKVRDDKEEEGKGEKDDTQNLDMETLQKQAALHFVEVLRTKGPLPLKKIHGYASICPVQVRKAIPGGPVKIRELFLKYPNIFTVDTDDIIHLQPTLTAEGSGDDDDVETSVASTNRDTAKANNVNHGKDRQEENKSTSDLKFCTMTKTGDFLNDATTVPSEETSRLDTCHAEESQQQSPTCEATRESAYMTAIRDLFKEQRMLSIVTIVEKLKALFSEDKIDEGVVRRLIKRHPDIVQLSKDDIVEEQPPVNVMGTITKVLKLFALATLENGSQVYIPKALYVGRMGVDCANVKHHLSKGDCILLDTEPGMDGRTANWAATNVRAIFKSPNIHISNDGTKTIDLHTAVPHLLATKATRSPSELDDAILKFVSTAFNNRTEFTMQNLNDNMRYLNHDALLHLSSSGGLQKFLQGHPDKFQIKDKHALSVNKEHSQSCINASNLDTECTIGEESSVCAMETAIKGTLHQVDMVSSHSDLPSHSENQATLESMITVHRIVNSGNVNAHADSTKCMIGEIQSLKDNFAICYLQNGEKALLAGLKQLQEDNTKNVKPCPSVGDCILLDVIHGSPHGATQWIVSKVRHILKKAVPSKIQCSESKGTHGNMALKGVLQQCVSEEQLNTVLAWFTFLCNNVRVSFKDLKAGMEDFPKDVQKCTMQKASPIQFLEQYPSLFHVDYIRSKVGLLECSHNSTSCSGGMPVITKSSSLQEKKDAPVQPLIEVSIVAGDLQATDSCEPSIAATIDQAAVEFFRNKVSEKGQVSVFALSSCFGICPMAIRRHVGSSQKGLIKFFKDHFETFSLHEEKVVSLKDTSASALEEAKLEETAKETVVILSDDRGTADMNIIDVALPSPLSSSSGDSTSDVMECKVLSGMQDVETIFKEGTAHFVEVLEKKGSMPLCKVHGHVNQLREEVKKAIGGGPEKARAFFLRFPSYFSIDADDTVHLTSKQEEAKDKVTSKQLKTTHSQGNKLGTEKRTKVVYPNGTADDTSTCTPCPKQQNLGQKASTDSSHDKFITAVKDILSEKGCLHLVQLVKELSTMFPDERFELSGVRLFLKKCPDDFQVNNQDMVEELPLMNVLAMVTKASNNICFATLEDTSRVFVYIALYRERMGVDCTRLQDHLSPGDVLLVDTEHNKSGSSMKWAAANITAVFKSSKSVDTDQNGGSLQTPIPFLPATTIARSPPEIRSVIVKLVAFFLKATSPLQFKDLSYRMKYLNHDAILYLREMGGLLPFLQNQPQLFQVQDGCVSLVAGKGELDEVTGQCLTSPGAKCTIGTVSMIARNIAHLCLPDGKKAILDLTDAQSHNSISTSCLSVGDCVIAYVVPAPDQSEIPWVVSKVNHVMGKAAPAQVHAKTATATCGSHLLNEVLQQCVLEEEVDTVLTWHRLLSRKTKVLFEGVEECMRNLPKKARMYMLQKGDPCTFLEQYPTLFHVDRVKREICLVECSPMSRAVFSGGVKHVKTPPAQAEGNTQPVTEKPSADTDKEAVEFFRSKVLEKGQVSVQVLSTCCGSCPMAIRQHVGSSMKSLAKFLQDHPDTFSLDEDEMVCSVKEQKKANQIAHIYSVLQGGDKLATNAKEDKNDGSMQNVSNDSEAKHTVDQIDPEENQQESDVEVDPVDVKRETSELIFDLVQRCGEISFSSLQGYINLLGEDRQECIKDKGGLLSFLEHDQRFKIDHVSESISLKSVEETEPDSLTNTDKKEQQHPSTVASVKEEVEKTDISIDEPSMKAGNCDAENQHIPIREPGDDTGTSLLKTSHTTEDQHDCVDVSTVVTPSDLVTSETNVDIAVSPVQTLSMLAGPDLNQEQTSCDSATAVPTATVHPMAVTNDSSLLSTEDGSRMDHDSRPVGVFSDDLSTESRINVAVQTEETGTVSQVSQSSTAEDTNSLLPSSVDRTQARSTSDPVQGRPLHLLVGEDGTSVWANSGQQDMQPLTAVCPTEGVVPMANPPGLPDDFTSLLPMFKDNLRPIQDSLVEVEMDIGRVPIARYYNQESPLLAATRLSEQTLTRETLETILFALPLERSAIGQGRVLLRGSLHWVSTLKNSLGEVVGLTLRRGQAVPGCLDLLWDVVTSGTSTLIVGRPCSGKTTLLREWARILSDVCYRRVIVVDTLNEIAGGDDIPHPGIGGAKRVQVHNRCDQVSQLQTAARNHSPDCIIVDEVQTQEEVTALQAIRLTGIQVVAGVCAGCLTDLLHNSVMRGLLGLSDPPSSTSAPPGVSQQPLTFPQTLPVFQAAVTIHNRDTVSVYPDIASFVRVWLLEGRLPLAQHRKRVVTRDRETEL